MTTHHSRHKQPGVSKATGAQNISQPSGEPTQEQIAFRAYEIYVKSGCALGHCTENWQEAERSFHDSRHDKIMAMSSPGIGL